MLTLDLLDLSSLQMDPPEIQHAPRYSYCLKHISSSFELNVGVQSYDRKTIEKS